MSPGECCVELSRASQSLEATGESHGYREGLGSVTQHVGHAPGTELGQLEARVHADGIAQLLPENALLAVVGQLEQVEAGGGGGQAAARLPLTDGEEAPEDTAQSVPGVLII